MYFFDSLKTCILQGIEKGLYEIEFKYKMRHNKIIRAQVGYE
ncbi:hypothetical protein LBBP_00320 [Leptospira borgpetersenii serovar Ballum]|uniref:Uncharacterized protein n=1 Tax=Leptospira borgpetersenii serovar Ballum TaxID=280505 RepID=A0A0S2ILZ6_LEPBO|nr:hypothetical protein LBBP_00320 [Leptospira borgpetersenii serovar Ballum]